MTTYNQIWQCFLDNCGYKRSDIPQIDEIRYSMINNAKDYYNNIMQNYTESYQSNIQCADLTETLNVQLTSDELLIFANILKLIFLKNRHSEFISIYNTFAKELGISNYKAQADAKLLVVKDQEQEVYRLITNGLDDWEM